MSINLLKILWLSTINWRKRFFWILALMPVLDVQFHVGDPVIFVITVFAFQKLFVVVYKSGVPGKLHFVCKSLSTLVTFDPDCCFLILFDNLQSFSCHRMVETLKLNPQFEHERCFLSPCSNLVCVLSWSLEDNHWEQMLQRDLTFSLGGSGFLTLPRTWVFMCLFKLYLSCFVFPHKLQLCGPFFSWFTFVSSLSLKL